MSWQVDSNTRPLGRESSAVTTRLGTTSIALFARCHIFEKKFDCVFNFQIRLRIYLSQTCVHSRFFYKYDQLQSYVCPSVHLSACLLFSLLCGYVSLKHERLIEYNRIYSINRMIRMHSINRMHSNHSNMRSTIFE